MTRSVEERKRSTEKRNKIGMEKSEEGKRGTKDEQENMRNGKVCRVLHVYYVIGRGSRRRCRTSLAVVAYRDGQLS